MTEIRLKNQVYLGAADRESAVDITIPTSFNGKMIVFSHGFMGFKDWGCWQLVEDYFTAIGFGFCKYNVSHNGGTASHPIDFPDLSAFAENSYSKEKYDLQQIFAWIEKKISPIPSLYLIGHSRGGGIALLTANDYRVNKIASWSAICSIEKRFPEGSDLKEWQKDRIRFIENGRTLQKMPQSYTQYQDFLENREQLSIEDACKSSTTPTLLVHGSMDSSVLIEEGKNLAKWLNTELIIVEEANHTYGSAQPWTDRQLPKHLRHVCKKTAAFFLADKKI
jgi:uncharacterized protein